MPSAKTKTVGAIQRYGRSGEKLNDKIVESLSWDGQRSHSEELGGRGAGRLVAEARKNGNKVFKFKYYPLPSKPVEINIGEFRPPRRKTQSGLTVAEARSIALKYSKQLLKGQDPKEWLAEQQRLEEQRREALEQSKHTGTLGDLINLYSSQLLNDGKKNAAKIGEELERHVINPFPHYCNMPAKEITPNQIVEILRPLAKRKVYTTMGHVRAYLHAAFNNGMGAHLDPLSTAHQEEGACRFYLTSNPVASVKSHSELKNVGTRHLSEQELCQFWHQLPMFVSRNMALFFRLLIALGGQRPFEILQAKWEYYDEAKAILRLPGAITKNGQDHEVPLNRYALDILAELREYNGDCVYPFPARLARKRQTEHMTLDPISKAISRYREAVNFEAFTAKDLRRTCKTLMASRGFDKEIMQQIHNHAKQGVDDIHYNKYSYLKEKREALDQWADILDEILADE